MAPLRFSLLHERNQLFGQGIMLRSLLDECKKLSLYPTHGSKLGLPTQGVRYQISLSRLILQHVVKFSQEILPSRLFWTQLLLALKVTSGHIVRFHHELGPKQVVPPCAQTVHYRNHLLFLYRVPPLCIVAFSALKGYWMLGLHQHTSNSKIESISVYLKW